jgi:hypothetical protein
MHRGIGAGVADVEPDEEDAPALDDMVVGGMSKGCWGRERLASRGSGKIKPESRIRSRQTRRNVRNDFGGLGGEGYEREVSLRLFRVEWVTTTGIPRVK